MRLHAIVEEAEAARAAVAAGATIVQLRLKATTTAERVRVARPLTRLDVPLIINDDLAAALEVGAAGVHLGQEDPGAERAIAAGLTVGISAATTHEARAAEAAGASYLGTGPVWSTPSKPDAGAPIGLGSLAAVCAAVRIPVVAIGGIDAARAAACMEAGAAGVAVIRGVAETRAIRAAVDAAYRRLGT